MPNTAKKKTAGRVGAAYRALQRVNIWLAERLADVLASMAIFYGIFFLVTIPLHWRTPQGVYEWVNYLSSNFFQAVALPVLAFTAKLAGQRTEKLLQETHDAVLKELKLLTEVRRAEEQELLQLQTFEKMRSRSKCRQRNQRHRKPDF